jgi:hypothetical protein
MTAPHSYQVKEIIMALTAAEIEKRRLARLKNQKDPYMKAGTGEVIKPVNLTATQKANEIANRSAVGRTVTDKNALRTNKPIPISAADSATGAEAMRTIRGEVPTGVPYRNKSLRTPADHELDALVAAADGTRPSTRQTLDPAIPVVEMGIKRNLRADPPRFEVPGTGPTTAVSGAYTPQSPAEVAALEGVRLDSSQPGITGFMEDIYRRGQEDPNQLGSDLVGGLSDSLTNVYNTITGKESYQVEDNILTPEEAIQIESELGQRNLARLQAGDIKGSTDSRGILAPGETGNTREESLAILRNQGLRKLQPRDTALGRRTLGIPARTRQGVNFSGGTAGGVNPRMAKVLADNRIRYADRHARQQNRALQRVLRNTSGGRPGIANRQAFADDIANQRDTQTRLAGQRNDLLRTQLLNQTRERGQDLTYDLGVGELQSRDQYRNDMIAQGYSELEADTMLAGTESLDAMLDTAAKGFADSDEDDAAIFESNVAKNKSYMEAFLPDNIARYPRVQQSQAILASAGLSRAVQHLMSEGSYGINGPDDLMNMRVEMKDGRNQTLYEKLGKTDPTLWDIITTDVTLMGSIFRNDMILRGPGGKGKMSFNEFMNVSKLSARQLNALTEHRKRR